MPFSRIELNNPHEISPQQKEILSQFTPGKQILGVLNGREVVCIEKNTFKYGLIAFLKLFNLDVIFTKITGIAVRLSDLTNHLNTFDWKKIPSVYFERFRTPSEEESCYLTACKIANKNLLLGRCPAESKGHHLLQNVCRQDRSIDVKNEAERVSSEVHVYWNPELTPKHLEKQLEEQQYQGYQFEITARASALPPEAPISPENMSCLKVKAYKNAL